MRRWPLRAGFLALGLVAAAVLTSGLVSWRLTQRRAPPQAEVAQDLLGIRAEPLRLSSRDGLELGAWLYEHPAPRCAVVLAHGNGSRRQGLLGRAQFALQSGCHALPVTLRAHGDSEGQVNDFGYGARLDLEAAVAYLEARYPNLPRYVFGQSLGAAAALFAAPNLPGRVQGYLLESPYASLRQATLNRLQLRLPSALVGLTYRWLTLCSDLVLPVPLEELAPERAAARVQGHATFIVMAGGADQRATVAEAQRIIDALPNRPRLEVFEGADHSALLSRDPARYQAIFKAWLRP